MKKFFLLLIILSHSLFAAQDIYRFKTTEQQQQFESLTSQLRCLVCQNQNIAESNAALAVDLRQQIYQQIQQGEPDEHIIHYLVTRYGDYILYRPPFKMRTLGLWASPFLLLIISLGYLLYYIRKKRVLS